MSIPSHHFKAVWNLAVSRWRLRPGEGITDSQEAARFDEADIKRALFGIEEASKLLVLYFSGQHLLGRWRIKQLINRNSLCQGNTRIEVVQRSEKMVTSIGSKARHRKGRHECC